MLVHYGRGAKEAEVVVAEIRKAGSRADAVAADLAAPDGPHVDTLVKHFAFVLGARGIRVNAVAPGLVETDMSNFTKTDAGRDFTLACGRAASFRVVALFVRHQRPRDAGRLVR